MAPVKNREDPRFYGLTTLVSSAERQGVTSPDGRCYTTRNTEDIMSTAELGADPQVLPAIRTVSEPAAPLVASQLIPTDGQLALFREQAKVAGTLKDLRQMVAAWEAVAAKCDLAYEEFLRVAVFRLEVERDLGVELAQIVHPGRPKKRSSEATISVSHELPKGITKQQAAKYRALAAIPPQAFGAYIDRAREERRLPSSAGARRFAVPRKELPSRQRASSKVTPIRLPCAAFDAIGRIMTPDVCVGESPLPARRRVLPTATDVWGQLEGDVLVTECIDPPTWLPALPRLRNKGRLQQAIVVMPAVVWAPWFRLLDGEEWACCFVEGTRCADGAGTVITHHGARRSAFCLAMTTLGVVMR